MNEEVNKDRFKMFAMDDFEKVQHFLEIGFYGNEFMETLLALGTDIENLARCMGEYKC
jgi:hypothetical protein